MPTSPRGRSALSRIALDVSPLRTSRSFRLLWTGQLVSMCGTQIRFVAVPYQVWLLTRSPLAVGLLGAFQAGPLLAFSLWGGVIADAVDRRRLLMATQAGLMATSAVLALGTAAGLASIWFLYTVTAFGAAFSAVDGPARASLVPTLVDRSQIPAAMALQQVLFQASGVIGPAAGGLVLARAGLAGAYWIDVATFTAALAGVTAMRPAPTARETTRPGFHSLLEGLRYLGGNRVLLSTMSLDFVAMFFGWPRAMFPFYSERIFHAGPQGLGLMFAAPGAGALLGALLAGWVSGVRRQGMSVLACVTGWGLAIAGFGMLRSAFPLALALLACAGAADVFSAIFRGTILQLSVPDPLRGRMSAVNLMFVIGGPRLGEVESGAVAGALSPQAAVVSGGLACLFGVAAVAIFVPELARYKAGAD
jgi:predicted MFS family arabinose efflux permease